MRTMFELADNQILIAKARKGDLDAFEALYRSFEAPVHNLARRFCPRPQDAEDVVQETFLELFRSIRHFRGEAPLWVWVRKVTASKALMRIRSGSKSRGEEPLEEALEAAASLSAHGPQHATPGSAYDRVALERALARLSPTSRAVVWLHDVEGYTHEEIAEVMGRTPSFSKSQLARAHERLRDLLSPGKEGSECTQTSSSF
jgi:RNA polymerase sigma-70 factor (ECF subfamily)